MSVNFVLNFTRRRWRMPSEPGMPSGLWVAGRDEEGDASGGLWTAQHIFENVSNGLGDSNYYNLEQMMVFTQTVAVAPGGDLEITGMDPGTENGPQLQPIDCNYTFSLVNNQTGLGDASMKPETINFPIWIGTFKGVDTEFGDIIVRMNNPTATSRHAVKLQGYWWTPDAINAPGGMRRPPGSIYGSS